MLCLAPLCWPGSLDQLLAVDIYLHLHNHMETKDTDTFRYTHTLHWYCQSMLQDVSHAMEFLT